MLKDFAKFGKTNFKTLFNVSSIWMPGRKGLFEHKLTLDFILLTFIHAKWTKFKTTSIRTWYCIIDIKSL